MGQKKILIINDANFSSCAIRQIDLADDKTVVNVSVTPTGGGVVTGSGRYAEGASVTLTATANSNYVFKKWTDGVTTATRTITVGSTAQTYTAEFEEIPQEVITLNNSLKQGNFSYGYRYFKDGATYVTIKPFTTIKNVSVVLKSGTTYRMFFSNVDASNATSSSTAILATDFTYSELITVTEDTTLNISTLATDKTYWGININVGTDTITPASVLADGIIAFVKNNS